jgi:hypothetical protein
VQGTPEADFLPGLNTERFHAVWRKGYPRDFEDASAGIDVPAAGLLQKLTRRQGMKLGIEYVSTAAVRPALAEVQIS